MHDSKSAICRALEVLTDVGGWAECRDERRAIADDMLLLITLHVTLGDVITIRGAAELCGLRVR